MGSFFDNLIASAFRFFRRQTNESEALGWQRVVAKVTRFATSPSSPALPLLNYDYTFDNRSYSGTCTGFKMREEEIQTTGIAFEANPILHIRVDPSTPSRSRVLNSDNFRLPFEIDHEEDHSNTRSKTS